MKWISVKDSCPDTDDDEVLMFIKGKWMSIGRCFATDDENEWYKSEDLGKPDIDKYRCEVSYWMPLPEVTDEMMPKKYGRETIIHWMPLPKGTDNV